MGASMRNKLPICFALAAIFLMAFGSAFAHHGSGVSYVLNKNLTMEGTVTEFRWQNPHVYIMYDVKDAQGKVVNWAAETHSPIVCEDEDGWSKATLKPGDKVTISVYPSKMGTSRGLLAKIVLNGEVIIDDTHDTQRGRDAGQ
jgi:Family of unknown function (DUF6152)